MKKKKITKNGVEYWIDENGFTLGGKSSTPTKSRHSDSPLERFEHFKSHIVENQDGFVSWETVTSVNAHEYYNHYIKVHQDLEEYEECGRLLKLKNETPFSDEKTHHIIKKGLKKLGGDK